MADETLEAFFLLPIPRHPILLPDLMSSLDKCLQNYILITKSHCGKHYILTTKVHGIILKEFFCSKYLIMTFCCDLQDLEVNFFL